MTSQSQESVADSVRKLFESRSVRARKISTHYGDRQLEVVEIWEHDGVLNLSVSIPEFH